MDRTWDRSRPCGLLRARGIAGTDIRIEPLLPLLPLDGARRFGGHVIDHAIDTPHFVDNARGSRT